MLDAIPTIGFGTWQAPLDVTKQAVLDALHAGYIHIDCAYAYQNESAVGEAFDEYFKDHDRSKVWVTTKLWNTNHKPENVKKQLQQQLVQLKLEYVDLFLIHWSVNFKHGSGLFPRNTDGTMRLERGYGMMDTWKAMEQLVELRLTRFIGVSNFRPVMINDMLAYCKIRPYVNQIESHPMFQNAKVISFCLERGIKVTAYSPLGGSYGGKSILSVLQEDDRIKKMAVEHAVSVPQVVLRWHLQRYAEGYSVIPKSTHADRIKANLDIEGFSLTPDEMHYFDSLERGKRCCDPATFWGIPYFD